MNNLKANLSNRKQNIWVLRLIILLVTYVSYANTSSAQVAKTSELYKILKAKDSLLFNVSFNNCDISQIENLISEDFEFYHDKGGINESKESFIDAIKNGLCVTGENSTRRELVENSLQVFPLYNNEVLYGAIQIGIHRFYDTTAKFTHL